MCGFWSGVWCAKEDEQKRKLINMLDKIDCDEKVIKYTRMKF